MRMYQISNFITTTLVEDANLDAVAVDKLGKELSFYTHEDYHRLNNKLSFPYCHAFCYSKDTNATHTIFVVAIEVSALRVDSEIGTRVTTEKTTDNVGVVIDEILKSIKNELKTFGIDSTKGFTIENISEVIIPPRGEDDIRYMVEFEVQQKNC